jgi:hypothetical protein
VSSVDSSKTASSLSDAEARQYCQDSVNYNTTHLGEADTRKLGCGFGAAIVAGYGAKTDAEAKAKCTEQYNSCLAEPVAASDAGAPKDPCANAKAQLAGCSATVGELNACIVDQFAVYQAASGKDYCADAKVTSADAGVPSSSSVFADPASCKAARAKCPGASSTKSGG